MLNLSNVTLVALGGENIEGMKDALDYSCREIQFGKVKLVSHFCPRLSPTSKIEFEYIPKIQSMDEWSKVIFYELGDHVDTEYALLIHPDGMVVHPESWKSEFLNYDYIGAPWPMPKDSFSYRDIYGEIQRVGNSVSLRSKKLLDLPKKLDMPWGAFHGFTHEDGAICVNYRHIFEQHGCKYAPIGVAKHFGREMDIPENENVDRPFTFHLHKTHPGRNSKYKIFEKI